MIIAKFKFDSSIYPNYLPALPSGYSYTITDSQEGSIITRTLESDTAPTSVMFGTADNTTSREECLLDVSILDTSLLTSFYCMFRGCKSLQSIDASDWDTSQIVSLYGTFTFCLSLQSIDVSNWDMSQVINMSFSFSNCQSLQSLDLSNWDTSQVKTMQQMFDTCKSLQSLDLSNWDTSKVTNISYAFFNCTSLQSLDVSNWDTSQVTNMNATFQNCSSLLSLDVSNWDTSKVTNIGYTFDGCNALQSLDLSNWNTSSLTFISNTFNGCNALQSLDLSNWNISKATSIISAFYNCTSLQSLDVSTWDTSSVTNMSYVFFNCNSLQSLDVSNWDTSSVNDMQYLFASCLSLQSLDVSNWDTSQVTNMYAIFSNCSSLQSLDVSNWDTSQVTNMNSTFINCSSLQSLDLSNWDTSKVMVMQSTFNGCSSLQSLDVSNWVTSSVTSMHYTFYDCSSLQSLDVSNWHTSQVMNMHFIFNNCSSLQSLDVSNWDTSQVTYISHPFSGCSSLQSLGLVYSDIHTIQTVVDLLPDNNINIYINKNINISSINLTKNNLIHYDCEFIKIPLPEPLRAVGTSRDKIVEIDNKYYIKRECAVIQPTFTSHNGRKIKTFHHGSVPIKTNGYIYSYNFDFVLTSSALGSHCYQVGDLGKIGTLAVSLPYNTIDEANEYIQSNNIYFTYELKTPIYEEIDIPTLELLSKQGYTLSVDSNIPTPLSLDCLNFTYPQTLQPSTKYLIIFDSNALVTCDISLGGSTLKNCNVQLGTNVFAITTPSAISDNLIRFSANNFNVYNVNSPTSSFSISDHDISYDELIVLLNSLQVVYTEQTLTLGNVNRTKLTDADILIAVEKGWTVV